MREVLKVIVMPARVLAIVALFCWAASSSCASAELEQIRNLIPEQAYDLHEYKTQDGKRVQISFRVRLDYPALSVTDSQMQKLQRQGWSRCTGTKDDWHSFLNQSQTSAKFVYQHLRSWSKNTSLLTIMTGYEVDAEGSTKKMLGRPPTNVQRVVILVDQYANTKQLAEVQQRLGISC